MLTAELQERARVTVQNITKSFKEQTRRGFNMAGIGLPTFETQQDHDAYHPDDAGIPFRQHNEFANAVHTGLVGNGVPARKVIIRFPEYSIWLSGKSNTSEMRAAYTGYLLANMDIAVL